MAEEAVQATQAAQERKGSDEWANMSFPTAFVHAYEMTDRNGKTWQKAYFNIPDGVKVNGISLSGYAADGFLNDYQVNQLVGGSPTVTFGVKKDEKVAVFKGKGEERKSFEVEPFALAKGLKENREAYAAAKAAERSTAPVAAKAAEAPAKAAEAPAKAAEAPAKAAEAKPMSRLSERGTAAAKASAAQSKAPAKAAVTRAKGI
jgi:hypothetical protein